MKSLLKNKQGISALISIIIISAVALIIATTSALTAIDQTQAGLHQSKSLETFVAADSCLQQALVKLKANANYSGENLNFAEIDCQIQVSNQTANERLVKITANDSGIYSSKIEAKIKLRPQIEIISWQQTAD